MPKIVISYGYIYEMCDWELFCQLNDLEEDFIDIEEDGDEYTVIPLDIAVRIGVLPDLVAAVEDVIFEDTYKPAAYPSQQEISYMRCVTGTHNWYRKW
jgi:hypothetical protein